MNSDPIEDSPTRIHHPALDSLQRKLYDSDDDSGDDLFEDYGEQYGDTIATLPLQRPGVPRSDSTSNTASSPPPHFTEPTQLLHTPGRIHKLSQIQVPASSSPPSAKPIKQPPPPPPTFPLSSIAPPGTLFRPPVSRPNMFSSTTQSQLTDFGDPPIEASDSEDDLAHSRSDIPPSFPIIRTSQQAQDFRTMASRYTYNPNTSTLPQKRTHEDSAASYGNSTRPAKLPRTTTSSRPFPGREPQILQISQIEDFGLRQKAVQISAAVPGYPVKDILTALENNHGNPDDAVTYILGKIAERTTVDLTASDEDAQGETDSEVEIIQPAKPSTNRTFEVQKINLLSYSRFNDQKISSPQPTVADASSTPPRKPLSRLKRGIRPDRSSTPTTATPPPKQSAPSIQIVDDDDDEGDDDGDDDASDSENEAPEDPQWRVDINQRALQYLNTCSDKDLVAYVDCHGDEASLLLAKRPFQSLAQIRRIALPAPAGKRRGGTRKNIGDRIADKVVEVEERLDAVDRIVSICKDYFEDVNHELKKLGIDLSMAANEDGLALTTLDEAGSDTEKIDSGTGTPSSGMASASSKLGYLQQPSVMSSDFSLKDYQVVGLNWFNLIYKLGPKWGGSSGCVLADDMGLGKTCQVIAFLSHLYATGEKGKHLIIVPGSTIVNWLREFEMFSPNLRVSPYHGTQKERAVQREQIEGKLDQINAIIATYDIARKEDDLRWVRKTFKKFTSCIFDEGHFLKNMQTKKREAFAKVKGQFRVFLTGTPLQNNLQELISVLDFLMPHLFRDSQEDLRLVFNRKAKTTDNSHEALLSAQHTERAKLMLKPFILRRTKDQVLKDLPPKTRRLELCDMTEHQKEVYDHFMQEHEKVLDMRRNGQKTDAKLPQLMDRRQAAIHPLLRRWYYTDIRLEEHIIPKVSKHGTYQKWSKLKLIEEFSWYSDYQVHKICEEHGIKKEVLKNQEWMDSGKVAKLVELLRKHKEEGSRTLIFSQFQVALNILEKVLEDERVSFLRIDGGTPVLERQPLLDKFYEETDIQAFMITTRSGGAGINLACADKVIIFDPSFNPQDDIQAENRAHRIGQTKPVEVITLVTRGTIEEQIYKLGLTKLALDQRVAGANADDEGESGKVTMRNATLLEEMLTKGQTTPPEQEGETKDEMADGQKLEMADSGVAEGSRDAKDAFKDAMEAQGITFADE